jgi:hypothetical protein
MQWYNDFVQELQGPAQQHTLFVCLIVLAVIAVRIGKTNRLLHQAIEELKARRPETRLTD